MKNVLQSLIPIRRSAVQPQSDLDGTAMRPYVKPWLWRNQRMTYPVATCALWPCSTITKRTSQGSQSQAVDFSWLYLRQLLHQYPLTINFSACPLNALINQVTNIFTTFHQSTQYEGLSHHRQPFYCNGYSSEWNPSHSFFLPTEVLTVVQDCDPANCCYKNHATCAQHNEGRQFLTQHEYCAQRSPCADRVLATCDADCCDYDGAGMPC